MQSTHSVGLVLASTPEQKPVKFTISSDWGPANLLAAAAERLGLASVDSVRWRGCFFLASCRFCLPSQLEDDSGNIVANSADAFEAKLLLAHASESEAFLVSEENLAVTAQVCLSVS